MANPNILPIQYKPGIQRDGTQYNAKACINGQWTRFTLQEGVLEAVANKIGGYKIIGIGDGTIIRTLLNVSKSNSVDTYMGRFDSLKYQHFDFNGVGGGEVDRTPAGYISDPNNLWDFDLFSDIIDPEHPQIVAHVAPNANDVSNAIRGPVYYGETVGANQNDPLVQIFHDPPADTKPVEVSGGIVYSPPIMIAFDNNGRIIFSDPGKIASWPVTNFQFVANTKIIYGANYRGILLWTLNSLISLVYLPTSAPPNAFAVTTIESNITVMSPRSIVAYQQQFFWVGIDQFYFFNGVVQRLKNTMSTDWFFKNVNLEHRSKVWGMVVPGQREIWWFYPRGNATECTHVIIYNMELNCWYDSEIGRAAGALGIFPLPMMSDTEKTSIVTRTGLIDVYPLWMHEFGWDKIIDLNNISSIDSFFEVPIFDLFNGDSKSNRLIRTRRIEPNFVQSGDMTVTIRNRMFPSDTTINGKLIESGPYAFDENTQKVDNINSQGRLVSLFFRSNEIGGTYQMGKTLLNFDIGDVQP